MIRHVGSPYSNLKVITGAAHVQLQASDYLGRDDLDRLIRDLQVARIEVFGPADPQPVRSLA